MVRKIFQNLEEKHTPFRFLLQTACGGVLHFWIGAGQVKMLEFAQWIDRFAPADPRRGRKQQIES